MAAEDIKRAVNPISILRNKVIYSPRSGMYCLYIASTAEVQLMGAHAHDYFLRRRRTARAQNSLSAATKSARTVAAKRTRRPISTHPAISVPPSIPQQRMLTTP
ncbi:hypothetical protein BV98_001390 [Sphingobium herbicidovorans NBRC 16415]|uniref:Uncharacterized protein n=1 Tax=Sphingobium herbicidovorans (strain ATCC 700291 / DSM 11019 / CCUG 56400 / KCTC 2939 / LMG 18315 / NBRC 16415 / MH) TaxID=1219045 RepID=A0A086PBU1_SPHHM|nr:hypothetical protein BV98_001390 [Sphingobium herbicidovorans NBRC 16415]